MKTILDEEFYTIAETGNLLGLTIQTVRKYLNSGEIKGKKIGNIWYITKKQMKDYLSEPTYVGEVKYVDKEVGTE